MAEPACGFPKEHKINILYLHETAKISGAENSLLNLVRNLDKDKFTPYFVLPEQGALGEELKEQGIPVEIIPFPKIRHGLGVVRTVRKLIGLIRGQHIRVLHSNSIRTHIYAALAAKYLGIPCIWHQRNMLQKEIIDLDRLFSFLADKIVCNSAAVARRFMAGGRLPEKVLVVFNGVDTNMFNPGIDSSVVRQEFGIAFGEIVVGIASRFNSQKGHEAFFEAARIIVSQENGLKDKIKFLVVGGAVFSEDEFREKYLKELAVKMGIKNKVIFTGYRRDMPLVYAAMDIFVLTSDAEACGRVVLEAMASGKPVIGTDSGGTPEMLKDGVTGFLFKTNNTEDLARKIVSLSENRIRAGQMGEAGRKFAEDNFRIEFNARKIEKIYLELCRVQG